MIEVEMSKEVNNELEIKKERNWLNSNSNSNSFLSNNNSDIDDLQVIVGQNFSSNSSPNNEEDN